MVKLRIKIFNENENYIFNSLDEMNNYIIDNYFTDEWKDWGKEVLDPYQHFIYESKEQYWHYLDNIINAYDDELLFGVMNIKDFVKSEEFDLPDKDEYLLLMDDSEVPITIKIIRKEIK